MSSNSKLSITNDYIPNIIVDRNNKSSDLTSYFFEQRTVWYFYQVSDETSRHLCMQLLYLSKINNNPIHINIQSGGGSVYACLSIINTMSTIAAPVHITVCGFAASAAAVITSFGAKGHRYILKHSRVMLHQVITGMDRTSFSDFEINYNETKYLNDTLQTLLFERMKVTREVFDEKIKRDWFMSAEEAVEYGICDKIIS